MLTPDNFCPIFNYDDGEESKRVKDGPACLLLYNVFKALKKLCKNATRKGKCSKKGDAKKLCKFSKKKDKCVAKKG